MFSPAKLRLRDCNVGNDFHFAFKLFECQLNEFDCMACGAGGRRVNRYLVMAAWLSSNGRAHSVARF